MDYHDYNDSELLSYIAENSEEANEIIFKKYEPLIFTTAKRMYNCCKNAGLDLNDLIQEGRLGLNIAINGYKANKDVIFYTYAKTCIERRMISVIVSAKRLKHKNLNESISFDTEEDGALDYFLKDDSTNPEQIVIGNEENIELINLAKKKLTDFEAQVFDLMLLYFNYREIAEMLDKEPKQIDNAIQRIKNKVKDVVKDYESK